MGRGRKKSDPEFVKSKNIRIRLTKEDFYWLKVVAGEEHKPVCKFIRELFYAYVRDNYDYSSYLKMQEEVKKYLSQPEQLQ